MLSRIAAAVVAIAVAVAFSTTAFATGQTTNKTYKSAKDAATHVAAMFMNKRAYNKWGSAGWWHASDLKAVKKLSSSPTGLTQKWIVSTKSTIGGKPYKSVVVSVKKLSVGEWKGFSGGSWMSKIK
jgi:uncharacterized membrane protein